MTKCKLHIVVLLICLTMGHLGCGSNQPEKPAALATLEQPAASPSGTYLLQITEEETSSGGYLRFQISEIEPPSRKFVAEDRFSARHETIFIWDDMDRVWVYSGDVGVFYWEKVPDKWIWEKVTYKKEAFPPPPAYLIELKPHLFK